MKNKLNKKTIENLAQIAELRKKNAYYSGELAALYITITAAVAVPLAVVINKHRKEEKEEEKEEMD